MSKKGDPKPSRVHILGRMGRTELIARASGLRDAEIVSRYGDVAKMSNEKLIEAILDAEDSEEPAEGTWT